MLKIWNYVKLHAVWFLILLPLAIWAFGFAVEGEKNSQMTVNNAITIQNAIVDMNGVPMPGKEGEFFKTQRSINEAKSEGLFYKLLIYLSSGMVCLILILTTTTLMGYSFTEFKFLKYIGLFNKNDTLNEAEIEQGHRAFWGMIVILCINALTWIPLTILYVSGIT